MGVIRFAIQNPVKVAVAVLLSVLFGFIALLATPVQLTPDVIEPEITVSTRWPGASAQEVEREIVEEQEEQLKSVEGLVELKSESSDGQGSIVLKFPVGTDLADARAKVAEKLNQVPEYPVDAKEPTITTVNANANAIAWFILQPLPPTAEELRSFAARHPALAGVLAPMIEGGEKIDPAAINKLAQAHPELSTFVFGKNDPAKMRKFAEDVIEAEFERVAGVANANVFGGQEEEFRVVVDPVRLAAYQLTMADLRQALAGQNKNTSGGDIWEGKLKNVVRTIGQFDRAEKVAETIIAHRDGKPIRVRDVASVGIDYKKPDGVVRQKGLAGLAINAQQAPGTNLLEIMGPPREKLDLDGDGRITSLELAEARRIHGNCLRIATEELNIGVLAQRGLMLEQVYDQTDYLNSATALVQGNIVVGGTLAILVLLLFLRSPRSVLIVGLSIPISVIATFLFIRGFGRSINVISLAGMAFAVGMVVDNAIVVLENIFRHYQKTGDPEQASLRGATEVWGAVLASTLTTLAVFVPVIFVQGQAGQLFRDISIAISCAVGLSLLVSVTVIPSAARRLLGREVTAESVRRRLAGRLAGWGGPGRAAAAALSAAWHVAARPGRVVEAGTDACSKLTNLFADGMETLLRMRGGFVVRVLIVAVFISASLGGAYLMLPGAEYLPEGNRNLVIGILLPPPGYNVDQMIAIGERIEAEMAPYWEAKPGTPESAALRGPQIDSFFFVARGTMLFMGARSVDPLRAGELVPVFRAAAGKIPGMIPIVSQASLFDNALSGGRTIDIEITGPDLETLVRLGGRVFGMCLQMFPVTDEHGAPTGNQIRPIPSLDLSSPELHVVPKLERASELGITVADLGYAVDALVDGAYAGDYWHEGRKVDLVLYGADEYTRHTHDLEHLPIATPAGKLVNLGSVAEVKLASGPQQVNHIERQRAITVQLKPAPQQSLEEALQQLEQGLSVLRTSSRELESGLYHIRLAGTADKLSQTRFELQGNLLLALLITYLLMAALFESFFYPLVIMTSVVLALVGGIGGLAVLNLFTPQALDMLTMLGFVILIGTVVNNAILIVHQALNYMREDGWDDRHAVVESVRTRIRPIFMSTLTTVLGMLPLVLPVPSLSTGRLEWVSGAGSELYRGLGSVVLGGLIVSTVFTLVLVPVGFSLALDIKRASARAVGLPAVPAAAGLSALRGGQPEPSHAAAPAGNGDGRVTDGQAAAPAAFPEITPSKR